MNYTVEFSANTLSLPNYHNRRQYTSTNNTTILFPDPHRQLYRQLTLNPYFQSLDAMHRISSLLLELHPISLTLSYVSEVSENGRFLHRCFPSKPFLHSSLFSLNYPLVFHS